MVKIGIDPDTVKNGLAVVDGQTILQLKKYDFFDLLEVLDALILKYDDSVIIIEMGELNKSLFNSYGKSRGAASATGKDIGRNFELSRLLVQYCERKEYAYKVYKPTTEKFSLNYCKRIFRNMPKRAGEELRDALRACILG